MPTCKVQFYRLNVPAWRPDAQVSLAMTDGNFWLRVGVEDNPPESVTVDSFRIPGLMHNPHPIDNAPLTIPRHGLGCDLSVPVSVKQPCPLGPQCPLEAK